MKTERFIGITFRRCEWRTARWVITLVGLFWIVTAGVLPAGCATDAPTQSVLDEEMKAYKAIEASGAIAKLNQRLDQGAAQLPYEKRHGYLLALLRELNVPTSSQLLVASKTSPNKALISPHNPRALYFNDQVSIAYVPSAEILEVAATDPKLSVVFYTLDQKESPKRRLARDDRCLE